MFGIVLGVITKTTISDYYTIIAVTISGLLSLGIAYYFHKRDRINLMKKSVYTVITGLATTAALLTFTPAVQADIQNGPHRIEVAFVLDTTGSMADLIDGAKRKIWSIANTIVDIHPICKHV